MTAIQRWNRDEIENREHDVYYHELVYQQAQRHKKRISVWLRQALRYAEDNLPCGRRDDFYQNQNEDCSPCHDEIADGSYHRRENVVEHRILEIPRIHR